MQKRKLGKNGPSVPALGLGCMGMSISYGEPNDEESIATMHRAAELGANLLVTSDAYGNGVNEELIGRAIKGRRNDFLIATKFGNLALAGRGGGDGAAALTGGHPDYVPQACDKSLRRELDGRRFTVREFDGDVYNRTVATRMEYDELRAAAEPPCIVHFKGPHAKQAMLEAAIASQLISPAHVQ